MECIVNKASMYTLCYVEIVGTGILSVPCERILCYVDTVGSGEFFQSRWQCKTSRAIFLLFLCSCNCGFIYTQFMCWRKTGMLNNFLLSHNQKIWLGFWYKLYSQHKFFSHHTSRRRVSYETACCWVSRAANNVSELQKNAVFQSERVYYRICHYHLKSRFFWVKRKKRWFCGLVANSEHTILFSSIM